MDINDTIAALNAGFADFKSRNNAEMDAIKANLRAIEVKGARPGSGIENGLLTAAETKHREAFERFIKSGDISGLQAQAEADAIEGKALNTVNGGDGGFAVPELIDRTIADQLKNMTGLRQVANVVQVGTGDYKKLVNVHGAAATWVGETSSRPETNSPGLQEVAPPVGELYANPAATQRMLDDVFFDAEGWLAAELAQEFGLAENTAFVSGDGTNKPKGFLAYTVNTSSDGARTFGHLQMFKTGVAGGFSAVTSSTNPVDDLIGVVHSLGQPYRANAAWTMNSATLERIRKFKDAEGNYIWRPGAERGAPSLLLGYPVIEMTDMPDVATNTFPIAFGDWERGYTIVDRFGTRILRDPYTNKPYVNFYATKRVGGAVVDSNAIKLLATRT